MNRTIKIPQYSIVMTIGPSNSGKSYLCKSLYNQLKNYDHANCFYLSSDDTRRALVGLNLHKHDSRMQQVSKQAFDLLHMQLDAYTSYPVNADVLIVDATNMSKVSRSFIVNIAKKNNYNLIGLCFDYKDMDDYTKYLDEKTDKRVIYNHVKMLRTSTLKEIDKADFKDFHKITSIDFSNLTFEYSSRGGYKLPYDDFCVVGDLHGCYDELIELLLDDKGIELVDDGSGVLLVKKVDGKTYVHHVLIGDIVDKGSKDGQKKLVEFLYKNRDFFTIVEGNHDRWVHNYLTGVIKKDKANDELIANWFDSVTLFEADRELRDKFIHLYKTMYTFVYNDKFIATHAPCENKYLGKTDKVSLKKQNTIMYPKEKDYPDQEAYLKAMEDFFSFLIRDSEFNYPVHVFGHVMLKTPFNNKNKWGIDTGCVVGNMLTSLVFSKDNVKPYVRKYKSQQPVKQELNNLFRTRQNEVHYGGLDILLQRRIRWAAKNKVNFVSGTMSPTDKDMESLDIESLDKGIKYFRDKGVNRLVLEPKFMGSRCNILLHRSDLAKCKALSRNAYEIDTARITSDTTMEELFKGLMNKHANVFDFYGAEYLLMDGELLPWTAMGKTLIESDFVLPYKACRKEIDFLRDAGFEDMMSEFTSKFDVEDTTSMKPHEVRLTNSYRDFKENMISLDEMESGLELYRTQLDIFTAGSSLEYSPFALLKVIKENGDEINMISSNVMNSHMFSMLSNEEMLFLDYDENIFHTMKGGVPYINFETAELALDYFWKKVTVTSKMEGLVIKPDVAYIPGVAPYMKCRNKEYLRLTYGFDYDKIKFKTEKLIRTKNIKRKLDTSVKEYELGRNLLDVKMNDISIENNTWLSNVVQLLTEQENEKTLDPRL